MGAHSYLHTLPPIFIRMIVCFSLPYIICCFKCRASVKTMLKQILKYIFTISDDIIYTDPILAKQNLRIAFPDTRTVKQPYGLHQLIKIFRPCFMDY